ncbi:beta-1,3-galactosyltransferase 1-like isoform X2 [Biomphalaria glabrata]|uniref:Hexosyltransferase n=1 Tax=Biomphalaria glabrata TaxID=6526 RepID=A0A9W2YAP2_BIOGL|nr:beta-1,3-galactosyltransferase 1-like isoform X2 [Biomphalaria glabrata]
MRNGLRGAQSGRMSTLSSALKNNAVKLAVGLAFIGVNILLYKQSTHIAIAQFLGYPSSEDSNIRLLMSSNYTNSSSESKTVVKEGLHFSLTPPPSLPPLSPSSPALLKKLAFLREPVINPHPYNYTLFPSVSCSKQPVELAICVPISRDNFMGRQTIRETWGSYANSTANKAVLVFFIGSELQTSDSPSATQRRIDEESKLFGDILQESYIDHYNNLSLKSVSILKWVASYCSESRYVLKADDDMYVNIPLLAKTLPKLSLSSPQSAFVVGSVQYGARPIRSRSSKWYTPHSVFKGSVYPNYASGTAYAMTTEAAQILYEASLRVPLFWLEDIYITGLCTAKSNVLVMNSNLFTYDKPDASGCSFRAHISGHRYKLEEIRLIHRELYDPNTVCEKSGT